MLIKLAFRNVRRSVRDYAIYFVTLLFGVAIFYAFNSISSQSILFDLRSLASQDVFEVTGDFMSMFSVVVACVLGFLVIYANRFLIKRRKLEFGTYLLLGMKSYQVSTIVLLETALVGLASLALGLACGIALSQALSFFTASMFNIPMQQYRFVFASDAFASTLACFILIFVVVALFNVFSISRYKLINLLSARNKNERFKVRNPYVCLIGFIVSVVLLIWAYKSLIANGLVMLDDPLFIRATILMIVGTFLFFWSLAGFVLAVIMRIPQIYFKKLALFTTRQIAGKINTAFISLSIICIMLFFSLTVLSAGMGLAEVFSGDIEKTTPFDATLTANVALAKGALGNEERMAQMYADDPEDAKAYEQKMLARAQQVYDKADEWDWDIERRIESDVPGWLDAIGASAQIDIYQPHDTLTITEALQRYGMDISNITNQSLQVVSVSDFNAVRTLAGQSTVTVGEGEYAVTNSIELTGDLSRALAQKGQHVSVMGYELEATGEYVEQVLATAPMAGDPTTLIVPDSLIGKIRAEKEVPTRSYLNVLYATDAEQGDAFMKDAMDVALLNDDGSSVAYEPWPVTIWMTANDVRGQAVGMRMMLTYLALYIGFVFLITTSALLAIQQLSETSDSLGRYRTLAELGCDKQMIFKSLKTQVLIYFIAPLSLALCHTICALGVLNTSMFVPLGVSVASSLITASALLVLVYGTYLILTYFASRAIVKNSLGKKLLG